MKNAHLSRIKFHSKNKLTDQLYQPLRQAIRKNSQSKQKKIVRVLSPQPSLKQIKYSKISNKIRSITPQQAYDMQNNIYIPASRRLVATNDLQKVQGKKFVAVDVNVHYNQPLTQQEFKKKFENEKPIITETLYSISSTPTQQTPRTQSPNLNSQPTNIQSTNQYQLNTKKNSQLNQQASPPKLKGKATFEESQQISQKKQNHQQQNQKQIFSKYHRSYDQSTQGNLQKRQGMKNRREKSKSNYKYNLFSALDEGTNTKCNTCWVQNQIIASKPSNKPWS